MFPAFPSAPFVPFRFFSLGREWFAFEAIPGSSLAWFVLVLQVLWRPVSRDQRLLSLYDAKPLHQGTKYLFDSYENPDFLPISPERFIVCVS